MGLASSAKDELPDLYEALGWIDARVFDPAGIRLGTVEDVYVDHGTPEALLVRATRLPHNLLILPVTALESGGLRLRVALATRLGALRLPLLRP